MIDIDISKMGIIERAQESNYLLIANANRGFINV